LWTNQAASLVAVMLLGTGGITAAPVRAAPRTCNLPATANVVETPWAQRRLDFTSVWPVTKGAGVVVAVVDTGVQASHPMLNRPGHVLPGLDVVNNGGVATTDCHGHGTVVAGIIGAERLPGVGFAGVAPAATILPIRQTNDNTDGTVATLAQSISAAVDRGAWVINVSVTVAAPSPTLLDAVRYAQRRDRLIVASAGNEAENGDATQYPAAYPGVVSVGAVGPDEKVTKFSDSRSKVSVVAPGKDILGPGAGGTGLVLGQDGTSFSAAYVSGVAALVHAYRPHLTAQQVKRRLEATADHPAATMPDPQLGWGMVNPYRAVTAVLPEEHGVVAQAAPAGRLPALVVTTTGTQRQRQTSLVIAAALALAAGIVVVVAVARSRGRERGWRPAERP
jgi:membrane-anchored mycosin MYCP